MALKRVGTPKERMQKAHALIKQKNYLAARHLLKDIDNPTAQQWRDKLDEILLEQDDPFVDSDDFNDGTSKVTHHPEVNKPLNIDQLSTERMDARAEEQLAHARRLIAARQYERARAILENTPHSLANEWIAKIDEIQSDPFSQPAIPVQVQSSYDYSSKANWAIVMFFFLWLPGSIITSIWYNQAKRDQAALGQELPGVGTLKLITTINKLFLWFIIGMLALFIIVSLLAAFTTF
jgi:hypothetical protein